MVLNIISIVNVFDVFGFTISVFEGIFGLIIISSSFQMRCVRRNFLFMMTGVGRGFFNIYVGLLMFFTNGDGKWVSYIMGFAMIGAGLIFLFLSRFKNVSDEDINRAVSVQKKSVFNSFGTVAKNNEAAIKQAAWDNRDVIGQVAYDNRDVIAKAAYDNRELLADQYQRNRQNMTTQP